MCGAGRAAPRRYPRGGDRRSGRIEGAAAFLLAKVDETPAITLAELQALLKERHPVGREQNDECGSSIAKEISFKKNRARCRIRIALTSPRAGWPGSKANPITLPTDWCSAMRPAPRPRWPVCGSRVEAWPTLPCRGTPHATLEDNDLLRFAPDTTEKGIRCSWFALEHATCLLTRSPASNRQSRRRARHVCSCRLIRPTSIPSNKPSPNSRPCSERPPLEPSMTYGMPSPRSSNSSHQPNAPTSSLTQDMNQNDRKML